MVKLSWHVHVRFSLKNEPQHCGITLAMVPGKGRSWCVLSSSRAGLHTNSSAFAIFAGANSPRQRRAKSREEPKAGAQKPVLRSVLLVDPSDHGGRNLKGTSFHPYSDRVLLRGRIQVDHIGASRYSRGGHWGRLDWSADGGDVCRRRCKRQPLWRR